MILTSMVSRVAVFDGMLADPMSSRILPEGYVLLKGWSQILISVDSGSSVIMYKNADLRKYQYYIQPDWAGGKYAPPRYEQIFDSFPRCLRVAVHGWIQVSARLVGLATS